MNSRYLGATGISVSDTALGTMNFGGFGNTDRAEVARMIHTAIDAGISLIDTADRYGDGESERIVGEAIRGRRDEVVLATKFGLPDTPDANRRGASPRWIRRAVEASLQRLGTDHIDLYQLHRYDWNTGLDETLGALSDLKSAGLIRAFGHSMFPAEKIVEAQWIADRRGHARFVTEQARYSLLNRRVETSVLPTARRYDMGVLTFSPLANGWLSGRDLSENSRARLSPGMFDRADPANARRWRIVEQLKDVASQAGMTLPHLATAFVRVHPAVTAVIVGPRTPAQLDDLIVAAQTTLTADVLDAVDAIVTPGSETLPADYLTDPPSLSDPTQRRR
ncbi:aldo/keto reductase [Microbacterium testaceum]|jgi:aryl-alcohol dehydrogenase-like predicted oxidoreductase|uniref:aldo/keto reductase n=1 Tax=Microbacterium testaceum TaxID=2033 RepID=UPI0007344B77|nr:aldo/keto reductase [Microbacterium testaceum]KTS85625.1 aldo/keto reductase [Microbacterium testaceum]